MRGDVVGLHIVRGVLNGTEVVHFVCARHDYHAARVLTRGALNAGTALGEALYLSLVAGDSALLDVFLDEAHSGFFGNKRGFSKTGKAATRLPFDFYKNPLNFTWEHDIII